MLIAIHDVKLYAHSYSWCEPISHCYTWSEGLCSFVYMDCKFMLIAIPGGKHNAWTEGLCSLLYME